MFVNERRRNLPPGIQDAAYERGEVLKRVRGKFYFLKPEPDRLASKTSPKTSQNESKRVVNEPVSSQIERGDTNTYQCPMPSPTHVFRGKRAEETNNF